MGAHHFINTRDGDSLVRLANSLDMILVAANVDLNWDGFINALRPKGKLHIVGAAPSVSATVFPFIIGQESIGGSPPWQPGNNEDHAGIRRKTRYRSNNRNTAPVQGNDAMEKLRTGKPRFRLVLENDLD